MILFQKHVYRHAKMLPQGTRIIMLIVQQDYVLKGAHLFHLYSLETTLEDVYHNVLIILMLIIIPEDVYRYVQYYQVRRLQIIQPIDALQLVLLNLTIFRKTLLGNVMDAPSR